MSRGEAFGWFDEAPVHWSVLRLKRAVRAVNEKRTVTQSDRYIGLENIEPWTGRLVEKDGGAAAEGVGACFRAGDVLFGKLRPYLAKAYLACGGGIGSTELLVLRGVRLYPGFLRYCLTTPGFVEAVTATTYGAKMPRAKWDDIGGLFVPVPPPNEQMAIVDFLDREAAKIDALIEKQSEFVTRLEEHRRALVSEAVTHGLRPASRMRDTGLGVIPAVPIHWAVQRLRHVAGNVTVGVVVTPTKYYADTGVPALRSLNVRDMQIVYDDLVFFDADSNRLLAKSMLHTDDVVAVRTGKPGTTAVVRPDLDGANCIDLIIIRKSPRFVSRFLAYVMNSDLAHAQYAVGSEGAIQQHFNIETAKDLLVPLPPTEEQAAIVQYLDARLARLDALRVRSAEMIERLREHRAALVTAAVTGKIDLRAAAPGLLEVAAA